MREMRTKGGKKYIEEPWVFKEQGEGNGFQ